ncbi:thioesterase superfamily protein [Tieghemostelium lacteum]|uniref:Acyl-coenzyme A thioesterase 13 n=1 Tax=Tieghemostelium lacteum TaxID=361077 RepID=A0A152A9Q7_TIELA|nr:thioesterase superfamily protein [Tieghemostelium lacteum]|eukprot:KYR02861.1 thioesterase superfamily protein [Tieghemostelium lacteum]
MTESTNIREIIDNLIDDWKNAAPIGFDINILKVLELETIEKGNICYSMVVPQSLCNIINTLHGGAIGTIVDVVSSIAIVSMNPELPPSVSVEICVHYAATAKLDEKIKVYSNVYKMGKNLAFTDTTIRNSKGDIVAKASHTKYIGFKPKL